MSGARHTTAFAASAPLEARLAAISAGARPALARAASLLENGGEGAHALARALAARAGSAHVVGITGAPGAGKSTLINALLGEFLGRGVRIAVVAVDPSSPISGGAVLGDRVRMGEHGLSEDVFIRSLSARGHLGGVSRATRRIVDLFDAAGFGLVIVETVGAGQSEVEIRALADTRVVVCPPGLGDDVQAIKAGILEIADLLVVNKGDSPLADRTVRDLRDMLRLRAPAPWRVPVLKTVATTGEGIAALADQLVAHRDATGTGKRLHPGAAHFSADEVSAVDRAIGASAAAGDLSPTPLGRARLEEILAAALRGRAGAPPWRIHAVGGARLDALRGELRAESGGREEPFRGASAALILAGERPSGSGAWLETGAFLQNVRIAAHARGLAAGEAETAGPFHPGIARWLGLRDGHEVVCAIALGPGQAPERGHGTDDFRLADFVRYDGLEER